MTKEHLYDECWVEDGALSLECWVEDGALSLECWVEDGALSLEDGALSLQCLIFCTVDTLNFDAGECTICLDDMAAGENVCICVYMLVCVCVCVCVS